jgi:MFS family permease
MLTVLQSAWALLLGILLLLIGNGLQGTLLGIRGAIEGFDAATMSFVMSAYYLGFLAGSMRASRMIRRVGHVRVFAALASLISAAFVIYVAAPDPFVWAAMRLLVGFCFAGVYVVAESWLNGSSTNETRGQALSLYMIVQMLGIISAQGLLNLGDPSGYGLFIVMSVLVSVSFAPILLTVSPAPTFQTTKRMTLGQLYRISPLGCVGTFLLGGVFAGTFGMAAVFGTEKGLSVAEISAFVAAIYTGGLLLQYPIGWISDRVDRRKLIIGLTLGGAVVTLGGFLSGSSVAVLLAVGLAIGGVSNPLYSLLIAYTNDFLGKDDMAAASGGLLFLHGLGAIAGPLAIGALMAEFGADAFFGFIAGLFALIGLYGSWRMTRRPAPAVETTGPYAPVLPTSTAVALEVAQGVSIERAEAGTGSGPALKRGAA